MFQMMRYVKLFIPAILLVCFSTPVLAVKPVTNVTAATGGNAISNSNLGAGTWVTLTGPSLSETANNGISVGTIVLNAPIGFKFNPASAVTVSITRITGTKNADITLSSTTATVTASTITITVTAGSSGQIQNRLTWVGIQVAPTACIFPAINPGNITITGTSITNGTNLSTNIAGALTETGSPGLTFIQQPTNTAVDAAIAPAVTVGACGNGSVLPTVTVALTPPTGGAILSGTLAVVTNNVTGLATFSNLSVNTVGGPYTLTATSPGLTSATSSSFMITSITPGRFNTFESSTAAGAIVGKIYTKIAGTAFTLDIIALNPAKTAVMTTFTGAVKVELLDASNNTGVLDTNNCRNTWTTIQTLAVNPIFVAGDLGRKVGVSFTENNSWKEARIRVTYPATGAASAIGCSTDNFAIRPSSLNTTVSDNDWQTAGTARTLDNTADSGGKIHKAGQPFTLQASAVPATATNYTGTPLAALSACVDTGCTAAFGTFTTGTGAAGTAVAGVINSSTASYTEAGAFTLQLQDQLFSSVDAADGTPATCAGQYVCSAALSVGRFVPDHFTLSAPSIVDRSDICPAGAGCPSVFTYMGEQMSVAFTLTAQEAGGGTTQNYAGVLAKLNPTAAGNPLAFGALDNAATRTPLTARLDTSLPATGSFAAGVANVSAPLAITRGASPDGVYAALDIGIAPVDADGVKMDAYDMDATNVVFTANDHTKVGQTEVRYGRIKLSSAHGSEFLPLPITATVQYWDSASGAYTTSSTDSSTSVAAANISRTNWQQLSTTSTWAAGSTSVIAAPVFVNGVGTFKLAAPGTGKTGSVDLSIVTAPSYLLPSNPARATFGVYKNSDKFIYQRENY